MAFSRARWLFATFIGVSWSVSLKHYSQTLMTAWLVDDVDTNDNKIMKLSHTWKLSVLYIVKYRQSFAFGSVYICGHFLWIVRVKPQKDLTKSHKSSFVVVLNTMLCSLEVSISLSALVPRTRDRSNANLGKCALSFAACSVCSFPTFNLCSTAKNNGLE